MDSPDFKFTRRAYFPTFVFQMDVTRPEAMNGRLIDLIYGEQERDQKGIERSNVAVLGGWHSHTDLHKSAQFDEITGVINAATARLAEDQGYDDRYMMKIGTMWSIINPPGCQNRAHVHPGCLWSGVYYIQAPDEAGDIEFFEPRTAHLMNQPRFKSNQKRAKDNWTKVRFSPTPGRMIIFPSWLYHAVDTNMAKGTGREGHRVIISFNINQVKK